MEDTLQSDFEKLISTLHYIGCSAAGITTDDELIIGAEALLNKFFNHSLSIKFLFFDLEHDKFETDYSDFASINVLARAAYECFLLFNYIYYDSKNDDQLKFRFFVWKRAGIIKFNKTTQPFKAAQDIIKESRKELDEINKTIKNTDEYKQLSREDQKKVFKDTYYRPSWGSLGKLVGLDQILYKNQYSYLCGYAHSDHYATFQSYNLASDLDRKQMSRGVVHSIALYVALATVRYASVLNLDESFEKMPQDLQEKVLFYCDLSQEKWDQLENIDR